MPTTLMMSN